MQRLTISRSLCLFLVMLLFGGFVPAQQTATQAQQAQEEETAPAVSLWDGENRFTVLIMGMDRRPGARDTLNVRTDAILLVSFDPQTDSIGMLHIPRDLHFAAPDVQPLLRVNTLMIRGESLQEGYGPYYMMDVIQYNLGIFIDAYIAFDFEAFISVVDALGGVEITTTYTINDPTYPDMNYGFDPFYLPAGTHLLDGRNALKFARTRHGDNDYNRGVRQMEVLRAIALRATDPEVLPGLIMRAPSLMQDLSGNMYTDLMTEDVIQLGMFGARIPLDNFRTGSINQQYIDQFIQGGVSVAIPDRTLLTELMTNVFGEDYSN